MNLQSPKTSTAVSAGLLPRLLIGVLYFAYSPTQATTIQPVCPSILATAATAESQSIADYYDQNIKAYKDNFTDRNDDDAPLLRFVNNSHSVSTLDAGCGDGRFFPLLSRNNAKITGIDFSEEMLKVAQKNYPGVRLHKMDLRELNFNDGEFDSVVAMYSLIHLPAADIQGALEQFHRILKSDGTLFLALQQGPDMGVNTPSPIAGHSVLIHLISSSTITTLLAAAGFEVTSVETRDHIEGLELPYKKMYVSARKKR